MLTRQNLMKSNCVRRKSRQILNNRVFYPLPVNIYKYDRKPQGIVFNLQKKSLVWCPVYKAASTNWMHNLLHLAGKTEEEIKRIMKDHPQ